MSPSNDRNRLAQLAGRPDWCSLAVHAPTGAAWAWAGIGVFPAGQLLDVSIVRGRATEKDSPEPASLSFTLVGDLAIPGYGGPVDVGMVLHFQLHADAVTALAGAFDFASEDRYWGVITDMGDRRLAADGTPLTPVICSSLKARLPSNSFGRLPWPAGTSDIQILTDTLSAAWDADKTFAINSWNTALTKANWYAPAAARPAIDPADRFIAWDVDAQTHGQVIDDLQTNARAVLVERRNGQLDWINPPTRAALKAAGPTVTLGGADLLDGATVAKHLSAVVNKFATNWGNPGDVGGVGGTEIATNDISIRDRGNLTDSQDVKLANAAAAQRYSREQVTRYAIPKWMMTSADVDLTAMHEQGRQAVARQLLAAELGALVQINDLPAPSPVTTGLFWLEGITEAWTSGRATMALSLVPYEFLAAGIRFQDVPNDVTFDDAPFNLTFDDALTWVPLANLVDVKVGDLV